MPAATTASTARVRPGVRAVKTAKPIPARTASVRCTTVAIRAGTRKPVIPGITALTHAYGPGTGNCQPNAAGRGPRDNTIAMMRMNKYTRVQVATEAGSPADKGDRVTARVAYHAAPT